MSEAQAPAGDERGQAHVVIYLDGATGEQVDQITDGIADVLVAAGLACDESDEDAPDMRETMGT